MAYGDCLLHGAEGPLYARGCEKTVVTRGKSKPPYCVYLYKRISPSSRFPAPPDQDRTESNVLSSDPNCSSKTSPPAPVCRI